MSEPARSVWGVVPVKGFESAKSRLATILAPHERQRLARSMFEHVLTVLRATAGLAGVVVVTDSSAVVDAAAGAGAVAVLDPAAANTLADCVDHGLAEVRERGATAAVVLVSDLPMVTAEDVGALVERLEEFDVVLAKDKGGDHTNALALRLGTPFPTSFGTDDSLRRHRGTAQRIGLSICEIDRPSLAFDLDTPEDYVAWVEREKE